MVTTAEGTRTATSSRQANADAIHEKAPNDTAHSSQSPIHHSQLLHNVCSLVLLLNDDDAQVKQKLLTLSSLSHLVNTEQAHEEEALH